VYDVDSATPPGRRVCLLTGAAGVLGSDFCRRRRRDYDIVAVYRDRRPDVATQDDWPVDPLTPEVTIAEQRDPVFSVHADLRDSDEIDRVVELALARFGRIDLVVNAAVHVDRDRLTSLASSADMLAETFAVNATMPIAVAAVVARRFWLHRRAENEACGRNVVNISSMASFGVVAGIGLSAYSASKVALNMLTGHLAAELRPIGVRVNAIAPTSFPRLVPTSVVTDAVVDVDNSDLTGTVFQLDETGCRAVPMLA
jgi:NAD(P)-dependent dehydrogenase (short-subunit alcohol dehydrogenase family)